MKTIQGDAARLLIERELQKNRDWIGQTLAPLEPRSTFESWFTCFRAMEELFNLPLFGIDDPTLAEQIIRLPIDETLHHRLAALRLDITELYGEAFFARMARLLVQLPGVQFGLQAHGFHEAAAGMQTIGHFGGYIQSRRRHFAALLYALPRAAKGTLHITPGEILLKLLPIVEAYGINMVGLQYKLALAAVDPELELYVERGGFTASRHFDPLGDMWLEPERADITEAAQASPSSAATDGLEPVDPELLFSCAELRNSIALLETSYSEFDLAGTAFSRMGVFVRACLAHCQDEWRIELDEATFGKLARQAGLDRTDAERMIARCADYPEGLDADAPFIVLDERLVSSLTLLNRWLYYFKSHCLNKKRRFQIRSGFMFEDAVRDKLMKQGFELTDVRRIDRKEFDVVARLDGAIHNFQCKNNFLDFEKVTGDPVAFARANRKLLASYRRALLKEAGREHLLKRELSASRISHWVISRFPIVSNVPAIIPFNEIEGVRARCEEADRRERIIRRSAHGCP